MSEGPAASAEFDALWRFSVAFYARPGVAEALLALQDRHGLDVNLILYALWHGVSGRGPLAATRLAAAEAAVRRVRHEIVEPLRRLRRALKPHPDADIQRLRDQVKGLELEAERLEQQRLAAHAETAVPGLAAADRAGAASANLALCLGPALAGSAEAGAIRALLADFMQDTGDQEG